MQQEPTKLTTVQSKSHVQAALRAAFPTLPKSFFTFKSDSQNGNLSILWPDGPTEAEVRAVCEGFTRPGFSNRTAFIVDGQPYLSGIRWNTYTRYFKREMLTRCAILLCRKYQRKLPDILWSTRSGAYVKVDTAVTVEIDEGEDVLLSTLIREFAEQTSEATLVTLEQEIDAYPPLPTYTDEEQQEKARHKQEARLLYAKNSEIARQQAVFCRMVYKAVGLTASAEAMTSELKAIEAMRKKVFPNLSPACVCSYCYSVANGYQQVGTNLACPECIAQETAHLTDVDVTLTLASDDFSSYADALPLLASSDAGEQLQRDANGVYIGRNGEPIPILTRDLLQDIRFGKWWLGFAYKPSDEIRTSLHDAGWRWGWGKREWFHPNKFASIPQEVINQYGGYVDGGFSVYREQRGERLRDYADRVEDKADQREEMSNALVAHYMTTGTLIIGPRRTRALQKKKHRAERYRQEAESLDRYANDLRHRANASERHQERVTRTPMLRSVIKRLLAESRKLEKQFVESVYSAAYYMFDATHECYRSVTTLLKDYEEVQRRQEIITEEVEWLEAVIEQRRSNQEYKQKTVEAHAVPEVPKRAYAVDEVVEVNVGADNALDLHPTSPTLGDQLLHDAELYPIPYDAQYILEPHGGTASLLKRIVAYQQEHALKATLHTCELDSTLNDALRQSGYEVVGTDFLAYDPGSLRYDAVIMNPPFSNWIAHVKHGYTLLAEGGTELAIVPRSFFNDRPAEVKELRTLVEEQGAHVEVDGGTFRESGTDIAVVLLSITK